MTATIVGDIALVLGVLIVSAAAIGVTAYQLHEAHRHDDDRPGIFDDLGESAPTLYDNDAPARRVVADIPVLIELSTPKFPTTRPRAVR